MPEVNEPEISATSKEELPGLESCALGFKEDGNKSFNAGDYKTAIKHYSSGLKHCSEKSQERTVLLKNRAAAYLKLGQYENVIDDTTAVIDVVSNDVKAYFRRCQAYQQLGRPMEAMRDGRVVMQLEPKNAAIHAIMRELSEKIQVMSKEQASTVSKVKNMFDILLGEEATSEKRIQSANNLVVLAREKAGSQVILQHSGIPKLLAAKKLEKNEEISIAVIRCLGELCRGNPQQTCCVLKEIGIPFLIENLNSNSEQYVTAVQYFVQLIINSLSGLDMKEGKKKNKLLMEEHEKKIDSIMMTLVKSVNSRVMTAIGRDSILELIMKNVDYDALNWGEKLVAADGLWHILEVASELQEIHYESSMKITGVTLSHASVTLDRAYLSMGHDKARENFRNKVMDFINDKLRGPDIENKVRATNTIIALLQGPVDCGNFCLGQKGVIEMLLAMAGSDDELMQRVAAEAIIAAATKKDKCTTIITMGTDILKKLYVSKNDNIRVRALVGLCKVGSVGGFDASMKMFAEGSSLKLAHACRKFLISSKKDKDLKKWAAEGLSYLTLDAEVKEELIEDKEAISALIELAKVGDLSVLYGVVTTLVNLTNSYDKDELIPELVELAKFAKQHVPEEHIKDAKEFVEKRVKILAESGVTIALVALAKSESDSSREMIARVFNAMVEQKKLRGIIVQQGGAKALLTMSLEGNEKGKATAAQALSRIAITTDPEVAFPGQRSAEVVRPVMKLLHPECSGLQNFEALMALTNLAQVSPSVRQRILKDAGILRIEEYMYQDHEMLKRAAVQCMVNLLLSEEVVKLHELPDNDRVKLLVLLSDDEDLETAKAASGAIAILTEISKKVCKKVLEVNAWLEILCKLVANGDKELCHRGVCIVNNLMHSSSKIAEKIVETTLLELLMAITSPQVDDIPQKVKDLANNALKKAEELKLIKAKGDEIAEDSD